jgi:hypothetical protein
LDSAFLDELLAVVVPGSVIDKYAGTEVSRALDAGFATCATKRFLQVALYEPLDLILLCEDGIWYTLFFRFKHVTHAFDRPGTPTMILRVQSLAKHMHV